MDPAFSAAQILVIRHIQNLQLELRNMKLHFRPFGPFYDMPL
jgi:hypothetical protein